MMLIQGSAERFQWMLRCITGTFPHLSEKQVRHAANKIGNEIRKWRGDVNGVEISREPIEARQPYGRIDVLNVDGTTVHWAIISD